MFRPEWLPTVRAKVWSQIFQEIVTRKQQNSKSAAFLCLPDNRMQSWTNDMPIHLGTRSGAQQDRIDARTQQDNLRQSAKDTAMSEALAERIFTRLDIEQSGSLDLEMVTTFISIINGQSVIAGPVGEEYKSTKAEVADLANQWNTNHKNKVTM